MAGPIVYVDRSDVTGDPADLRTAVTELEVADVADRWRPHRSLALSYLFAAFDAGTTAPVTVRS